MKALNESEKKKSAAKKFPANFNLLFLKYRYFFNRTTKKIQN